MAADANAARLAFWARTITGIKGAGMTWPGFSYTDAEWRRLEVLSDQVSGEVAGSFIWLNAAIFIGLAAILMFGVFLPLATVMFPDPANTRPLPFALLLASVCVLTLGIGLPLAMRMTAWLLATEKVRSRLASEPDDEALWAKVRFQMTRMTVIMCGLLVPGILVFITFNIDGGPLITALKWSANAAVLISIAHTWYRRRPRPQ